MNREAAAQSRDVDVCGSGRVTVDEALALLLSETAAVGGQERVALDDAAGRVLAEGVVAPLPVPGHTNAAVDGYAVRGVELPVGSGRARFRVVGTALAGRPHLRPIGAGEAVRIMTGAILPDGADTVIMQEHVELGDHCVEVGPDHARGQNVRMAGEDLRAGETILHPGRWLTTADIGLAASVGRGELRVRRVVHAAIISTGSEVREVDQPLAAGAVYDSNRHMLAAAMRRMGVVVHDLGIVADDPEALQSRLRDAARFNDVIVSSGGVSAGEADFVRPVLAGLGSIRFWQVAMKPGRPFSFGEIGSALYFGLPGNPVAALVSFYWLVKPALEKRMGILDRPLIPLVTAEAETRFRKKPGRMEFQRAVLRADGPGGYRVAVTGDQGSGLLRSMSLANGLVVLPTERGSVEPGEWVSVLPLAAVI